MKRKILSLILVFAMTVSLLTVGTGAVEPTYGDTAGHWAESSIERWSGHGIIQGSNGLFDPNGQLTCAQLATILAKLLKLPAAKDAGFTDNTADAWYYDAINRCAAAGILNGNGDGTVTPDAPISRERAMVMLARALGIEPLRKPDLTKYTDAAQVSAYAQGYVAALIEAGIVGGVTVDELAPQDNITRAATVTILDRAISTYADKAGATVKADGKGIVLVVAENVKITDAPEGTKIVVADGATGLTVNGKSVSDDQTYIVPKTTTSSGSSSGGYSHSHTWVDNYCNGCGQFKDTVVAAIGKKGYETLAAAIAAAKDGDTIKLEKSGNGDGFTIDVGRFNDRGLTIDFNRNTYMIGGQLVGSPGTGTNGCQLNKNNKLTLKNGYFVGVTEGSRPALDTPDWHGAPAIMVQNYCDLTLENMVVTGGDETVYTVSNNCGNIVIKDSTISQGKAEGTLYPPTAFDVCRFSTYPAVSVTVQGNSVINGDVEVSGTIDVGQSRQLNIESGIFTGAFRVANAPANITIYGGTFSTDPNAYVADGYEAKDNGNDTWTVVEREDAGFVAQIGGVKYTTLAAAIAAAQDGATVKLVGNETVSATVAVDKNLTLDLGGNTLTGTNCRALHITSGKLELTGSGTVKSTGIDVDSSVVRVGDNNGAARNVELVIGKDVVIESPNSYGVGAFGTATTEKLTIYGTIESTAPANESYDGCAVTTLGTDITTPATITIKEGAVISAEHTNAVYLPAGTLTVEGGTITGTTGIYFKSTNMTISGGTITGNGVKQVYQEYHNGGISTGEAVTIDSCNYPGGIDSVSIRGGEFSSTNANAIGSYNSNSGSLQTNFVTGGTFSSDPSEYVAEGYIARTNNDGKYVVSMVGTAENPYTLTEFNALTKLPAGRTELYVDIGDVSLANNDVTIGNTDIADVYTSVTGDYTVGQKLDDGRVVTSVWNESKKIYLANTNKLGTTLYIRGSVKDNNDYGLNNTGDGPFPNSLNFVIPDASTVVFTKDFTVDGYFRCLFSWNDKTNLGGGVASHKIQSVLFDHSTFNGIWIQNGGFEANSLTLDGCTFNAYENKVSANDSNPLWFCNTGSCDITVMNCNFTASRPIKLAEQSAYGTKLTIVNNTFDMSVANTANKDNEPKNDAIMLCKIGNGTLGNVVISGNTVEKGTALMAFYNPVGFTMAEGADFTVSGNTLNNAALSVVWKSTDSFVPGFITGSDVTQ